MKNKNQYIFVIILLFTFSYIQFIYHQEYSRSLQLNSIFEKFDIEQLITKEYNTWLNLNPSCKDINLPFFKKEEIKDNNYFIQLVIEKVLEDFSIHLYDTNQGWETTTISILVNARRKNFILSIDFIKQNNNEYLINNIEGLCDFLEDINQFQNFIINESCI